MVAGVLILYHPYHPLFSASRPPTIFSPQNHGLVFVKFSADLPEAEGFGLGLYLCSVVLNMLTCLSFSEMIFVGCRETGLIPLGAARACLVAATLVFTAVLSLVICMLYSLDL